MCANMGNARVAPHGLHYRLSYHMESLFIQTESFFVLLFKTFLGTWGCERQNEGICFQMAQTGWDSLSLESENTSIRLR